ncbi:MAG: hypothetical protein ABW110_08985 [Steroidobacteraceae bacterium]
MRDRSWGKPRPETVMPVPPMSWMTAVFRDDFAFNCTLLDHASGQPERNGRFVVPDEQALNNGWVYRDGKLGAVIAAKKRVVRAPGAPICLSVDLRFTDGHDRQFDLLGSLVASLPDLGLEQCADLGQPMRWDCEGLVAYGDNQEVFWGPFMNSEGVSWLEIAQATVGLHPAELRGASSRNDHRGGEGTVGVDILPG